jgi:hypothetical protein
MSEAVTRAETHLPDGYAGYTDETEAGPSTSIFLPPLVKFSNDFRYVLRDGTELPTNKDYIAPDVRRYVIKWSPERDQAPERFQLGPNERWPNLEERNASTPRSEWVVGPDGEPKGPWVAEHQVLLVDDNMAQFLFVTTTGGGHKAVSDLAHQTRAMREIYKKPVCPVVRLKDTLWSKRFKRQRPLFEVKHYAEIRDGRIEIARLTAREATGDAIQF